MTNPKQFLLSDVGNDVIGNTKTFATIHDNHAPKGSFTVDITTTYNKAKDPDAHLKKFSLYFRDSNALADFADFLSDNARNRE